MRRRVRRCCIVAPAKCNTNRQRLVKQRFATLCSDASASRRRCVSWRSLSREDTNLAKLSPIKERKDRHVLSSSMRVGIVAKSLRSSTSLDNVRSTKRRSWRDEREEKEEEEEEEEEEANAEDDRVVGTSSLKLVPRQDGCMGSLGHVNAEWATWSFCGRCRKKVFEVQLSPHVQATTHTSALFLRAHVHTRRSSCLCVLRQDRVYIATGILRDD
ncbi:hypothetical protein ALC53_10355 [Atta colombica]|uniref:Uncharacterized protein n=1 Tax=Atta colombica TaxID=520822 RepID=A0A195B3Y1_9HYME|nr:hypothetical protein ALC53_10355 [Atta colombica]